MVGAGTVFSRSIIDSRPENAAPWRVEIEYANLDTVIFDVQFRGNRKTIPAGLRLFFSADRACDLPFERLPREVLVGKQAPVAWRVGG